MKPFAPKPAIQLGLFALLSAALLAGLHTLTKSNIQRNQAQRTAQLLANVTSTTDSTPKRTQLTLNGHRHTLWRVYRDEQVIEAVLEVTASGGYSGDIDLLVGINQKLVISGVRVTYHRETPGLGDKIDTRRSPWIESFKGLSLGQPAPEQWAVKKDGGYFDQFTGATITPRAVVKAVRDTLVFSQKNHSQLFHPNSPPDNQGEQP
ncbi:MAG: electron transport complex subunit RsxG [Granulosicoccaceae bacterium]